MKIAPPLPVTRLFLNVHLRQENDFPEKKIAPPLRFPIGPGIVSTKGFRLSQNLETSEKAGLEIQNLLKQALKKLIKNKTGLPLCGNNKIAFTSLEIFSRKKKYIKRIF